MSYKERLSKIARLLHTYWKPIILFILLFFIIIIPTCINLAFKYNSGIIILQAEWDASDALNFYGGILAAGLGIYGVFLSIQYAQKNYRDDLKNQVLPYLVVTQLRGLSRYNALADGADIKTNAKNGPEENKAADPLYEEYKLTKVYYIIEPNGIKNYIDLPPRYKPILERAGASWETVANGCYILQKRPYISFPAEIENVGNGTAIYARIGFNKKEDTPKYLPPIQLKPNETFYIHIFSSLPLENVQGQYTLSIIYQDIYLNKYEQNFPFTAEEHGYHMDLNNKQSCK